MLLNNGIQLEENKAKLKELGIVAEGIDIRNVDSAIKIVEEYNFEKVLGRCLTNQEQKGGIL